MTELQFWVFIAIGAALTLVEMIFWLRFIRMAQTPRFSPPPTPRPATQRRALESQIASPPTGAERIELHPAFMWDCAACGAENFARAVRPELPPEEHQQQREHFGIADDEEGEFLWAPEQVTCRRCHGTFEAIDDRERAGDE